MNLYNLPDSVEQLQHSRKDHNSPAEFNCSLTAQWRFLLLLSSRVKQLKITMVIVYPVHVVIMQHHPPKYRVIVSLSLRYHKTKIYVFFAGPTER